LNFLKNSGIYTDYKIWNAGAGFNKIAAEDRVTTRMVV